jgi:hypothetical protein
MCGILGYIGKRALIDAGASGQLLDIMANRGPEPHSEDDT